MSQIFRDCYELINLDGIFLMKRESGELRIARNNGFPATIDHHFYMYPLDLRKIVVKGQNNVLIIGAPVLNQLDLATESESELMFQRLKVTNLVSRRECKSRMDFSSELTGLDFDSIFFLANAV